MKSKIIGYIAVAAMTVGTIAFSDSLPEFIFILGIAGIFFVAKLD